VAQIVEHLLKHGVIPYQELSSTKARKLDTTTRNVS